MYELEVNEENIKETLIADILGRNESIYNFLNLIYSIDTKCTISIDGDWGTGKTFFVKQIEYIMNLLNGDTKENLDFKIQSFVDKIKNKLEEKNISTYGNTSAIYYNACEYDYFEEPILTIIASIIKNNSDIKIDKPEVKEGISEKLDSLLSSFKFGFSYQRQNGDILGIELQKQKNEHNSIIEKIILDKKLEENFKQLLEDLLVEKSNRLVIFIDELDRCNPTFAVKLLEKIKYYFNDERFIFVFSTNLNQLQYTIERYYGQNFDGSYYLQKFFDYQLELPEIKVEDYVRYSINLINMDSYDYFDNAVLDGIKYMNFQLRDCNKYFELLKLRYSELKRINSGYSKILLFHILFPLLLSVKIKDFNKYIEIKNGKGEEEFKNLIINSESAKDILFKALNENEMENIEKYIKQIYSFLYVSKSEDSIFICNKLYLNRKLVNMLENLLSYLGENIIL